MRRSKQITDILLSLFIFVNAVIVIINFIDTIVIVCQGNLAGARAGRLTKQREKQKLEYEAAKNKIKEQNAAGVGRIDDKFNAATDSLEQVFLLLLPSILSLRTYFVILFIIFINCYLLQYFYRDYNKYSYEYVYI